MSTPSQPRSDHHFMGLAIAAAEEAATRGEVPVGAILVDPVGEVLARASNRREERGDPTAHAEVDALRALAGGPGGWRRGGSTLYVTLEPCTMCMGALILARTERLVYGAADPKGGAAHSLYRIGEDPRLNHRVAVTGGVRATECGALLSRFFAERRAARRRKT